MRCKRREQDDAAAFPQDRQELLEKEEGCTNIDRKQPVKILDLRVGDGCGICDASIGYQNIQPPTNDGFHLFGQFLRPGARCHVSLERFGPAAVLANTRDDGLRLIGAGTVVNQDLRPGFGQRQRARPADATRGTCHQSMFSRKIAHIISSTLMLVSLRGRKGWKRLTTCDAIECLWTGVEEQPGM